MSTRSLAERVVALMYDNDPFSKWLGIERKLVAPGQCELALVVRREMLNGFAIAHGGICYSLADSCLAFAANGHGIQCVSVETSISHTRPVKEGDRLLARAQEMNLARSIGIYHITITDQHDQIVALFKGTVHRSGRYWFPEEEQQQP